MATSAIWNATQRAWLTTFALTLISFSLKCVMILRATSVVGAKLPRSLPAGRSACQGIPGAGRFHAPEKLQPACRPYGGGPQRLCVAKPSFNLHRRLGALFAKRISLRPSPAAGP